MLTFSTIVAPITALGGAVAVVRLSGDQAWKIAEQVFHPFPAEPQSHRAYFGKVLGGDEGLMTLFKSGSSYTGEESCEFSIHGSPASVRLLVEATLSHGAILARPGEFTERAFLNGRLDLSQAEAVRDTIESKTDRQLRNANMGRSKELAQCLAPVEEHLLSVLATIEAHVDFSEELGPLDKYPLFGHLGQACSALMDLCERARHGRLIREGVRIALVGQPNVGKSSLLNALLGMDRAIVTPIAGTTRDYVEEPCELGGLPCVLIDTAGIRETEDVVESIGVQKSRAMAAGADLVWLIYDASTGFGREDKELAADFGRPLWRIANKIDLAPSNSVPEDHFPLSVLTGEGFGNLMKAVSDLVPEFGQGIPNERHGVALNEALTSVEFALETLGTEFPPDLVVTHLRTALHQLGLITGKSADADLLSEIFSRFCLGK